MQIIGVLDLAGGCAVHARGGRRDQYRPIQDVAGVAIEDGGPIAVARVYVEQLGIAELYAADLDAIMSGAPPSDAVRAVSALAPLWLDAGVSSVAGARQALETGATRVIVGLETLSSFDTLSGIRNAVGGNRMAFSLDLRDGQPLARPGVVEPHTAAAAIAARAVDAGVEALILIDLARVGAGRGVDLDVIARVRDAAPDVTLLAGGGIRGPEDLARLAAAGCDGALVASALHDGRLKAADVAAARTYQPSVSR